MHSLFILICAFRADVMHPLMFVRAVTSTWFLHEFLTHAGGRYRQSEIESEGQSMSEAQSESQNGVVVSACVVPASLFVSGV